PTTSTLSLHDALPIWVVETPVPGKPHAMRLGDAQARTFPRLYLDADVAVDPDGVRALVAACATPGVLAAAPTPRLDLTGVGPVRSEEHTSELQSPYEL